jgi:hypothetical protein
MKYPPGALTPFLASLLCIRRSARIPSEQREPKDLNQLSGGTATACSLFALSLQRFRPLACLFSTACSLFCKNTRGGGIPVRFVDSRRESTKTPDARDRSASYSGRVSLCDTPPLRSLRLCGIICTGLDRRTKSFASYHIPVNLAFSCAYALFCATAARQTLSPQALTHSFLRNRGGTPTAAVTKRKIQTDPRLHDTASCYTAHTSLNWNQ